MKKLIVSAALVAGVTLTGAASAQAAPALKSPKAPIVKIIDRDGPAPIIITPNRIDWD